jgi:hypothetical protein
MALAVDDVAKETSADLGSILPASLTASLGSSILEAR